MLGFCDKSGKITEFHSTEEGKHIGAKSLTPQDIGDLILGCSFKCHYFKFFFFWSVLQAEKSEFKLELL